MKAGGTECHSRVGGNPCIGSRLRGNDTRLYSRLSSHHAASMHAISWLSGRKVKTVISPTLAMIIK